MATLEDKILGEKLHNYCSSSEESDNEASDDDSRRSGRKNRNTASTAEPTPTDVNKWEGTSTNTGPKGVLEDWKKFKILENETRAASERQKVELAKKFTLTVKTALEEEREQLALEDLELVELLDDEFLVNYQKQRLQEMLQQTNHKLKFGKVMYLRDSQDFLDAIDKENQSVKIIIHIYDEEIEACRLMNKSLTVLSKVYENVKFCCILASRAGVSRHFKLEGVPALLVYKAGNLVGNFVKITDELGGSFETEDVQNYLVEHGLLEDKNCTPELIKCTRNDDNDSD